MKKSIHESGQIKTTPMNKKTTTKPTNIRTKKAVVKMTVKKFARKMLPNLAGTETTASRNASTGINQEMNDRKAMRMRQGL